MKKTKRKIGLISLGCAKNLVDSENLLGMLRERGLPIASTIQEAEIGIINTCGFIQSAVQETIDTILEIAALKKEGRLKKLVVIGCFVQRYGYRLAKEIKEVDAWLGTGQIEHVMECLDLKPRIQPDFIIKKPNYLADHTTPRMQTTPFYSAYLKIADGCSNQCTYCLIPRLTGPYRSRQLESLVAEAQQMAAAGVRELNLIAQDSTAYGQDLKKSTNLELLLEKLIAIPGLEWIRVLYGNPNRISDRLLEMINSENKICPYLDIPLQHVHPQILKRMGRPMDGSTPRKLIEKIRALSRRISIRTTFMIGFPGETDSVFDELLNFIEWAEFDQLGTFLYSPEKGTGAVRFKDHIDPKKAKKRLKTVMRLQADISLKKNRKRIGERIPVLIEGLSSETDLLLEGRTAWMAPDVDTRVLINKGQGKIGEIAPVRITEAYSYDLIGEIL
ncbi:MAG: 30S ribosomal protein S12 methylthiotransferase RimO [Desulfobacteraceae bacterium]|nr:MAG: 30S ribosomal protein S12 methylthiotransferase RimO [Desulfobacteraceae bacterium]